MQQLLYTGLISSADYACLYSCDGVNNPFRNVCFDYISSMMIMMIMMMITMIIIDFAHNGIP